MGGFFSKLFASKRAASSENEVAAAIAVALQMYSQEACPKAASAVAVRRRPASDWNSKSYGMTRMPQRNRRW